MTFKKNDNFTRAMAYLGGKKGTKHFAEMTKEEIRAWNSEMGKRSAIARRQRATERKAQQPPEAPAP